MAQTQPGSDPSPGTPGSGFPRVPAHAWSWFQRSRPVVAEAARRLTGKPPESGFVERLRAQFETDPFTRDVVVDVVAEVAFAGRIPRRRPPGASWDRGLIWWAAAISGRTVAEFEAPPPLQQFQLFGGDEEPAPPADVPPRAARREPGERTMLAALLRDVLGSAEDGRVPVEAIEHVLAQLEGHSADRTSRQ